MFTKFSSIKFYLQQKISFIVISIVFSLLGLSLRFERLAQRELWNDELYQLSTTRGAFKAFWERHTYGDMTCFPGDYLLTYFFVKMFDMNKWGMAIPHILATLLGFYFLYKIGERYFKTVLGFIVAFAIVALNQHLIFHSFELRPYAVLPTLMLAAFYFTEKLIKDGLPKKNGGRLALGLLFVLIIWFHAFGIMIVFFALIYHGLACGKITAPKTSALVKFFAVIFMISLPVWLWYALGNPLSVSKTYLGLSRLS